MKTGGVRGYFPENFSNTGLSVSDFVVNMLSHISRRRRWRIKEDNNRTLKVLKNLEGRSIEQKKNSSDGDALECFGFSRKKSILYTILLQGAKKTLQNNAIHPSACPQKVDEARSGSFLGGWRWGSQQKLKQRLRGNSKVASVISTSDCLEIKKKPSPSPFT